MENRLARVRDELRRKNQDALLLSSVPNIIYLTNFSSFSKDEREAFILITHDEQFILTDGRYSEAVWQAVPHFQLVEIKTGGDLKKVLMSFARRKKLKRIGIEEDNLTVAEQKMLTSCFHDVHHFSISPFRIVKEQEEIDAIARVCKLGDEAFEHVLKKVKEGITERKLAFELEWFIKRKGADLSFPPIVAFGQHSSVPHHHTGDRKLKTGDIVLLDFGAKVDNYCSDMTRTVFFGKASARQKKMYRTVLEAQQKAIEHLGRLTSDGGRLSLRSHDSSEVYSRSIKACDVDRAARGYIESQGFPTIPHSLGHGIGLEVHEPPSLSPRSKDVLKTGMVFSVEPGIYEPGFGGIRIEDLVVLEKDVPRLLTTSSKDLIEL